MIKVVIFDYGGVVIKILPDEYYLNGIAKAYKVSLAELNRKSPPVFKKFELGLPEKDFWVLLARTLKRPLPKNTDWLIAGKFEKNFVFYRDILSLLKDLRKQGLKTAVLTNDAEPNERVIKKFHGYDLFGLVIASSLVGLRKPGLKIYQLTVKKLGVKPSECVFIDDKLKNLKPAKKLGMKTVLAVSPKQVVKEVQALVNSPSQKE